MRKLTPRDKRALVILGAVAGAILLVFGVLHFLDATASRTAELEQKQRLLGRSIQVIHEEEVYQAQLDELRGILAAYEQSLLDAPDPNIATVQLEDIVRGVASDYNIRIARSNPLQERNVSEGYTKITLQLNLQSDVSQLTNFLYALSTHSKYLVVEDFSLSSFRSRDQIRIQPRLKVSGFIRLS